MTSSVTLYKFKISKSPFNKKLKIKVTMFYGWLISEDVWVKGGGGGVNISCGDGVNGGSWW